MKDGENVYLSISNEKDQKTEKVCFPTHFAKAFAEMHSGSRPETKADIGDSLPDETIQKRPQKG